MNLGDGDSRKPLRSGAASLSKEGRRFGDSAKVVDQNVGVYEPTKSATSCWRSSGNRFSFSVSSSFCIAVHRSHRVLQIMRAITACIKLSEPAGLRRGGL